MADIFDISFDQKAIELTPPDKRSVTHLKWIQASIKQLQDLWSKIFEDYKKGSLTTYPLWNNFTNYSIGDRVIYGQSVYEALTNNINVFPDTQGEWEVYLEHAIGADERVMYNHIKLVFEYALNTRFNTVFRQPPLVSDVFIDVNNANFDPFIVEFDENGSSVIFGNGSQTFVIDNYSFATYINFNINIPSAAFAAINANATIAEKIVRNFADKYNTIGLTYQLTIY